MNSDKPNPPKVFISYSHDSPEHEDRVLTLSDQLCTDGIDCILDQYEDSPPEGFPRWMDRQIRNADFVLMICTSTYYRRVMGEEEPSKGLGVQWESSLIYQYIYNAGTSNKSFIPLLFEEGSASDIPTPWQGVKYYRPHIKEGYEELYRRLTNQPQTPRPALGRLRTYPPRKRKQDSEIVAANTIEIVKDLNKDNSSQDRPLTRSDCYAHISFPINYVERSEVLTNVRNVLLSDASTIVLTSHVKRKSAALHGMGGIGKSVIARALCDDPVVQTAFPDGILWATFGQAPQLASTMRLWVNVLGGAISENAPTIESLKVTLAQLLQDRSCLLILDDVWQYIHADIFRVGGPRCRLLLTTRDAEIAHELGARVQSIPVMREAEAIMLLEEWADGHLDEAKLELKGRIVKRLGYLPLAVKLAGAQLQRKSASVWLQMFDVRKLKSQRSKDIHDNLELTFGLSLDELDVNARNLYAALSIFKEDEATPQVGIERLWQGLIGLDISSTTELLDDLAARALLEISFNGFLRIVRLHDLLRDLIKEELGDKRVTAHQTLLNVYHARCEETGWHTAEDDGYLYDHLAYHLRSANMTDELNKLFVDQHWLQVRVPQQDYTYDGYIEDLSLVWYCADAETKRQIAANEDPSDLADCIRYALIHTSINSIAENYEPALVARAVEIGLWAPRRALSVVERILDPTKRARMYIAILATAKLTKKQQEDARRLALETTLALPDRECAETMVALAPQLIEGLLERALESVLTMRDQKMLVQVLIALAPQLAGTLLDRVLVAALALPAWEQTRVLIALAPQLTGALLDRALEAVLALPEKQRAEALATLAPRLMGEQRFQALKEALEAAWSAPM